MIFASTLSWFTHKDKTHRTHRDWWIDTHILLAPSVMCIQQLPVLHWINNLLIQKIYFTEIPHVFAFQKLLTCTSHISLLIRFNKTNSLLWNTKNADRNGVNEKKHTLPTLRKITSERVTTLQRWAGSLFYSVPKF